MPKKKKRSRVRLNAPIENFRKALGSTKKPWKVIVNHKKLVGSANYIKAWGVIQQTYNARVFIEQWLLPKDLERLSIVSSVTSNKLWDELSWACACFLNYRTQLNTYLGIKKEIEYALAEKDYLFAEKLLLKMDRDVCKSLWSLERQIGVKQQLDGFDGNKRFIEKIISNTKYPPILRYLVQQISIRNEEGTPILWHLNEYNKQVTDTDADVNLLNVLRYLVFRPLADNPDYATFLNQQSAASVIDFYETFVRAVSYLTYADSDVAQQELYKLVASLSAEVDDPRLKKVCFVLNGSPDLLGEFPLRNEKVSIAHHSGETELAISLIQNASESYAYNLHHRVEAAKVCFDLGIVSFFSDKEACDLKKVFEKGDGVQGSYNDLIKASINCAPDWHEHYLRNIINTEFLEVPFHLTTHLDCSEFIYAPDIAFAHITTLRGTANMYGLASELIKRVEDGTGDPLHLVLADPIKYQSYKKQLQVDYLVLTAIDDAVRKDTALDIEFVSRLANSKNIRLSRYGGRFLASSLLQAMDLRWLIRFVGERLVKDRGSRFTLPLQEIGKILNKQVCRDLRDCIELSITLYFLSEASGGSDDRRLLYAYEDYLSTKKATKPSQLLFDGLDMTNPLALFYLRFVCSLETMTNSIAFESNQEVEEERLRVLANLITRDPVNTESYDVEIEEISKRQAVNAVISRVEQSKIYVDVESIKDWAEEEIRPTFVRYTRYLQSGIGLDDHGLSDDLIAKILRNETVAQEIWSETPSNEAYKVLVDMLRRVMTKFFFDSLHGLDSYLSVRIRHGAISSLLREPFSQYDIITQKITGADEYELNQSWSEIWSDDGDAQGQLNQALTKFSQNIDSLIEEVSREYIQIKSDDHPQGLIAAILNNVQVRIVASQLRADTSLDEFLDVALDAFWSITEHGLGNVREFIRASLASRFDQVIGELEAVLSGLPNDKRVSNLKTNLRQARTELGVALARFEDWFRRTAKGPMHSVKIEDIAEAALTSVKRARYNNFDPVLNVDGVSDFGVYSTQINLFNDIFFILFENVMKHSGLVGSFKIDMKIEVSNDQINFLVVNDVSDTVNLEARRKELIKSKKLLSDDEYLKSVNKEEKSGFPKLQKLLKGGTSQFNPNLHFELTGKPRQFSVSFSMNIIGYGNEENIDH